MTISQEMQDKLKGVTLDLSPLKSYKDQPLWEAQAEKKIAFLKSAYPNLFDATYERGYEHGYIEGRVEALEEVRPVRKPGRFVEIELVDGRVYRIPRHVVANNRANYYAERDKSTTYQEEYDYLMEETKDADSEVHEWLFNEMDWYELNPQLVRHDVPKLKDADVSGVSFCKILDDACSPGILIDSSVPRFENETK